MVKMVSFWGGARAQLAAHPAVAQFLLDNAANVERASDASELITVDTSFLLYASQAERLPGAAPRNMRSMEWVRQIPGSKNLDSRMIAEW